MSYRQLTEGQRYQIKVLLAQTYSQAEVARSIGVHPSTISRELKRNGEQGCYEPDLAQKKMQSRRVTASKYRIAPETVELATFLLSLDWSPEQISYVCSRLGYSVSYEWIYRYIARDKARGGKLYKHLRQGHKKYRKGRNTKRSVIPNPRSIEDRPEIVEARERLGDWEVDTVLGKHGTGALVTLAERRSRLYLVKKVPSKRASDVTQAVIEMLRPYADAVLTITADNGSEFVEHEAIAQALNADVYFAHPYSSWERGLNENFNGLLRQYIPKGTDLRTVSQDEVQRVQDKLNLRPRKCLGYRQPKVVFDELRLAA